MDSMTADDLGITGPHMVARTLDGDVIVEEVEHYSHRTDTGQWTALVQHRAPGNVTVHVPVPVERLEVRR